jgi:hypothetical protein
MRNRVTGRPKTIVQYYGIKGVDREQAKETKHMLRLLGVLRIMMYDVK